MLPMDAYMNIASSLVPITRFNRGEAGKIFDEVRKTGCKFVIKNNTPACVLLSPERYQEMLDLIEDRYLLALVAGREKKDNGVTFSFEEVLVEDGLTLEDIDLSEDVELE